MRRLSLTFLLILCLSIAVDAQHLRMPSAYLGAGVVEVTPERAKALKLPEAKGVEVKYVEDNSAAARAGLKTDDVILELNKERVESLEQFIGAIASGSPGAKAVMTVWRAGAKRTLTATLAARQNSAGSTAVFGGPGFAAQGFDIIPLQAPMIGIDGETLTPQLAQYFGVEDGVLVRTVNPRTPAERAGMRAGDVVTKVNGTPVGSPREITALLRPGRKPMVFTVVRNHKEITLNIELALSFDPWPPARPGSPHPDGLYLAFWPAR